MTAWLKVYVYDKRGLKKVSENGIESRHFVDKFYRVARVVKLSDGSFLVRTWRRPWRKVNTTAVVFRQRVWDFGEPRKPRKAYIRPIDELRKRMRRRSFVLEVAFLIHQGGTGYFDALLEAFRMRRQAGYWRSVMTKAANRRPGTEKRLYKALRNAPQLFTTRRRSR